MNRIPRVCLVAVLFLLTAFAEQKTASLNLMVIKEILHHSSVSTTQIYARADQSTVKAALMRHAARVFEQ